MTLSFAFWSRTEELKISFMLRREKVLVYLAL